MTYNLVISRLLALWTVNLEGCKTWRCNHIIQRRLADCNPQLSTTMLPLVIQSVVLNKPVEHISHAILLLRAERRQFGWHHYDQLSKNKSACYDKWNGWQSQLHFTHMVQHVCWECQRRLLFKAADMIPAAVPPQHRQIRHFARTCALRPSNCRLRLGRI